MTVALNILFLCTGNSARSILAEAILNRTGRGRFRGHSAGSRPVGRVNPYAIALLQDRGHDTSGLRSKSWEEFAAPGAPEIDAIVTVCNSAAAETCPVWPGRPVTAHWGLPDPAAVTGSDAEVATAFAETYRRLSERLESLVALPADTRDPAGLRHHLVRLGRSTHGAEA